MKLKLAANKLEKFPLVSSVCVCMYIYIYIYIYIYTHTHTHIALSLSLTHTYIHTYTYIYQIAVPGPIIQPDHPHILTSVGAKLGRSEFVHTHTHIHTHTYIHTRYSQGHFRI